MKTKKLILRSSVLFKIINVNWTMKLARISKHFTVWSMNIVVLCLWASVLFDLCQSMTAPVMLTITYQTRVVLSDCTAFLMANRWPPLNGFHNCDLVDRRPISRRVWLPYNNIGNMESGRCGSYSWVWWHRDRQGDIKATRWAAPKTWSACDMKWAVYTYRAGSVKM